MANASSKKIAAANLRTLDNLRKGIAIVNITYFLYRIVYHWATFTTSQLVLYMITTGVSLFLYSTLEKSGRPRYDASGALISGGDDLNAEGMMAYMFDIIYITWFSQIMSAFVSPKFWYTYLLIPAYAVYKIGPMVMSYLGSRSSVPDDAAEGSGMSKRQQKMEKRKNKGQVKYVR
ncbi:hypothetical protein BCR43DRAFT_485306 [Syncephalastrum racemosum]|uniref:DUF788-domain-containing protein n=1 Tax=Syncephalastrum racemosum TaxID=13706 RepID=A0A1X2HM75_SYNRA|nr:hypothetical protein BCR43DRAFT_485306 [Syncephalastrum racemosum]